MIVREALRYLIGDVWRQGLDQARREVVVGVERLILMAPRRAESRYALAEATNEPVISAANATPARSEQSFESQRIRFGYQKAIGVRVV